MLLVGCSFTSDSAIFSYIRIALSDGTDVNFPNVDLLSGTRGHRQLDALSVPSNIGMSEDFFNLLVPKWPKRGVHVFRKYENYLRFVL